MIGGSGDDKLAGGLAEDTFRFTPVTGRVFVLDFQDNVDTLEISKSFGYQTVQDVLDDASSSGGDSSLSVAC